MLKSRTTQDIDAAMVLKCLGSSSRGNCYLLTSSAGETLIIEIGAPVKDVCKALDWELRNVAGCLVSHKHQDHCAYADDAMKKGITIYTHGDVIGTLGKLKTMYAHPMIEKQWNSVGSYRVFPLPLRHADNSGEECKCWGFVVDHPEMGRLLFATDTMVFPYRLPKLNHIMIEANYEDSVLRWNIEHGIEDAGKRSRLLMSHMELGTTIATLSKLDLSAVSEIILIHLSSRNSDKKQFAEAVMTATGLPCFVAAKGFELQLTKEPY